MIKEMKRSKSVGVVLAQRPRWTRPCRGCKDNSMHNAHLTLWGRFYFRWLA